MNLPFSLGIPRRLEGQTGGAPRAVAGTPRRWHHRDFPAGVTLTWLAALLASASLHAFPPAPHHQVYGVVRDELGNPLTGRGAEVLLEAGGQVLARTSVLPGMEPGANYRLAIPLDSGATTDTYKPTALRPTVPFRMRVRIGQTIYLPLEMTGVASLLTRPAGNSRVDLTLGEDSDGDGLPDAWERALMQILGGDLTLADIRPEDDSDGDGMSNLDEYLAGTYAFDPADGFVLTIAAMSDGQPQLEFTAIRGRSYSIRGSDDMRSWTPVTFTLAGEISDSPGRSVYQATETRPLRAQPAPPADGAPAWRFFKLEAR